MLRPGSRAEAITHHQHPNATATVLQAAQQGSPASAWDWKPETSYVLQIQIAGRQWETWSELDARWYSCKSAPTCEDFVDLWFQCGCAIWLCVCSQFAQEFQDDIRCALEEQRHGLNGDQGCSLLGCVGMISSGFCQLSTRHQWCSFSAVLHSFCHCTTDPGPVWEDCSNSPPSYVMVNHKLFVVKQVVA